MDSSAYGNWGKVVVHEWAKLRWGVFEEHGFPGDQQFPMFFYKVRYQVMKIMMTMMITTIIMTLMMMMMTTILMTLTMMKVMTITTTTMIRRLRR